MLGFFITIEDAAGLNKFYLVKFINNHLLRIRWKKIFSRKYQKN